MSDLINAGNAREPFWVAGLYPVQPITLARIADGVTVKVDWSVADHAYAAVIPGEGLGHHTHATIKGAALAALRDYDRMSS